MKKTTMSIIALLLLAGAARAAWMVEDTQNPANSTVYASATQTNGSVIVSGELNNERRYEVGFMLFDKIHGNNPQTGDTLKWIVAADSGWVVYRFPKNDQWALTRYSLTSANDFPGRDPREWFLEGSNDLAGDTPGDVEAATWVPVDHQSRNEDFPGRWHTLHFPVADCAAYNAYRLRIVRNGGETSIQLGQWRMMGYNGPMLFSASRITHESTTLNGGVQALGTGGFNAWLYYDTVNHGDDFSTWQETSLAKPFTLPDPGVFEMELDSLLENTPYFARLRVKNEDDHETWSPVFTFSTPSTLPALGKTVFHSTPANTMATVDVANAYTGAKLVFSWGNAVPADGVWPHSRTILAPLVGANEIPLGPLAKKRTFAWRAELANDYGEVHDSGELTVTHTFTWVGPPSGGVYWDNPDYWDSGVIPNEPGARVVLPEKCKADIDIEGVGKSLTLGTLAVHGTTAHIRNEHRLLFSSDGTPIIVDNDGAPGRLDWFSQNYHGNLQINAPLVFKNETRLSASRGDGHFATLYFVDCTFDGSGPLIIEGGRVILGASPGMTLVAKVPILFEDPHGERNIFWVHGPGVVRMEGATNAFSCGNARGGLISNQGQLVLAGGAVAFTSNTQNPRLFIGTNNTLLVTEGSIFNAVPDQFMRFGGSNNTVRVTGPGSTLHYHTGDMDGDQNSLIASDGGCVIIRENHGGPFTVSGGGQTLRVSSVLPENPGVIDIRGSDLHFSSPHGAIILQPGGVITNIANLCVGSGASIESRLIHEGGQVFCNTLDIFADNTLEVVIPANGIFKPIIAEKYAWFLPGSKIIVTVPEGTEVAAGRYPLVAAPNVYTEAPLDNPAFFEPPPNFSCKLSIEDNAEGNVQTLFLNVKESP